MLYAAQVNSKTMARVTPHIPKDVPKERLAQQAEIALASFKAGVCVSANLSIGQFDSHQNNDVDQMKLIPEFLAGIAYVIRRAEALKIRDKLVIVIQSEMGRTPTYNKGNGKDYWSIGSVMFLAPGIKGNRVIGATDEKQFGVNLNPATLALDKKKGLKIRPEHIHEALREFAGIATHAHAKKFPLGLTEKEKLRGLWGCGPCRRLPAAVLGVECLSVARIAVARRRRLEARRHGRWLRELGDCDGATGCYSPSDIPMASDNRISLPDSLRAQFAALERALWRTETTHAVAGGVAALAASFALLFLCDRVGDTPKALRTALLLAGLAGAAWFAVRWCRSWIWQRRDLRALSNVVQHGHRRLGDRLLGIVELAEEKQRPQNMSLALCRAAIRQVSADAAKFDFLEVVNSRPARLASIALAAGLVPVVLAFAVAPAAGWNALQRWAVPVAGIPRYTFITLENVPAQLVVPHGEPFELVAKVTYRSFWKPASASGRFELQSKLSAPVKNGSAKLTIPGQTQNGSLRVRLGDATHTIAVKPLHRPALKQLAANVALPAYLQYPATNQVVQNATLPVLEGSRVTLAGTATRPLASAEVTVDKTEPVSLLLSGEKFNSGSLKLDASSQATFDWRDEFGLKPIAPWLLALRPMKDGAPRVDLGDLGMEVSILETDVLPLRFSASDDFGVREGAVTSEIVASLDPTNTPAIAQFRKSATGAQERRFTNTFMFSPTVMRIPADSVVEVKGLATDFLPGREPAESVTHRINIVSLSKHAELVRQQLDALFAQVEEVTRKEEAITAATRELMGLPEDKLKSDEAAKKAGEQADEQARNAAQLDRIAEQGQDIVREAMRNPTLTQQTLREWTQNLAQMKSLAKGDMKDAQQALQKAQESSEAKDRADEATKALEAEEKALEKLQALQKKMNDGLDNLQALTLSQRLKKLSESEKGLGEQLGKVVGETIGLLPSELPERYKKINTSLAGDQGGVKVEAEKVVAEMSRFFDRTQRANYGEVAKEMKEVNTPNELDRVRGLIDANISMDAMGNLATWTKRFAGWSKKLEPPEEESGGGEGEGQPKEDKLLKMLMAAIRLRGGEMRVLQQTMLLEEEKAQNPRYAEGALKVGEQQRALRGDLTKLQMSNDIEEAKEFLLNTQDGMRDAESALFDKLTGDPAQKPENDALLNLTDLINLINEQAKRQKPKDGQQQQQAQAEAEMMMQMAQQEAQIGMKPGQQPGGPNQNGGNTDKASAGTVGDARGAEAAARRTGKGSGVTRQVPAEFREALENFFKAVEAKP